MADNEPFGFDPQDLDRFLRGALGQFGKMLDASGQGGGGLPAMFGEMRRATPSAERETTGDTGDGVWAIYTVNEHGSAQVEQVYADELDALRGNKHNTDSNRKVRFLPYGMPISVLDEPAPSVDADPDES